MGRWVGCKSVVDEAAMFVRSGAGVHYKRRRWVGVLWVGEWLGKRVGGWMAVGMSSKAT